MSEDLAWRAFRLWLDDELTIRQVANRLGKGKTSVGKDIKKIREKFLAREKEEIEGYRQSTQALIDELAEQGDHLTSDVEVLEERKEDLKSQVMELESENREKKGALESEIRRLRGEAQKEEDRLRRSKKLKAILNLVKRYGVRVDDLDFAIRKTFPMLKWIDEIDISPTKNPVSLPPRSIHRTPHRYG